jgi:hypothetical protein
LKQKRPAKTGRATICNRQNQNNVDVCDPKRIEGEYKTPDIKLQAKSSCRQLTKASGEIIITEIV